MRIVKLKAENVKRLEAVEITPKGDVIEVRGRNAMGKSSVLDAIAYALGGERLCPTQPIRKGQTKAKVEVDLDDLVVTRTWTPKGSYLSVTTKAGEKVKSPQAVLDQVAGRLTFDPLAFTRLTPDGQRTQLVDLLGIGNSLTKIEKQRAEVYDNRREWSQEVKRLDGSIGTDEAGLPADLPDEEVSFESLSRKLEEALEQKTRNDAARAGLERKRSTIVDLTRQEEAQDHGLDGLKAELARIHRQIDELLGVRNKTVEERDAVEREVAELAPVVETLVDPDTQAIRTEMGEAEEKNAFIRVAKRVAVNRKTRTEAAGQVEKHTTMLRKLDENKAGVLTGAKYPIDGLGFDGQQVMFNGVPFAQASQAEQLKTSMAIAMTANPKLKVLLIRDGSLLDDGSLEMIYAAVVREGYQLWIERVGENGKGGQVLIEDGMVREDAPPQEGDPNG